jgi:hypothetical protein
MAGLLNRKRTELREKNTQNVTIVDIVNEMRISRGRV